MVVKMKNVNIGPSHINFGQTVTVDNTVTSFMVTVRTSGSTVSCDTIKDLIERRHEVVEIEQIDQTNFVRKMPY